MRSRGAPLALILPLCSKSDVQQPDWQAVRGDAQVQITNGEPVTPLGIALHELTTHCGSFEEEVLLREGVVPRVTSLSQTERCAEHDLHPSLAAIACCLCALVVCRRLLGQCFP